MSGSSTAERVAAEVTELASAWNSPRPHLPADNFWHQVRFEGVELGQDEEPYLDVVFRVGRTVYARRARGVDDDDPYRASSIVTELEESLMTTEKMPRRPRRRLSDGSSAIVL